MQAQPLIPMHCELAECPVWHDAALWWVDIHAGLLHRLDPNDHSVKLRATGDFLGAAVPTSQTNLWMLARRDHLATLDWNTGAMEPLAWPTGPMDDRRFNDGKCDPAGRFLVGTLDLLSAGRPCALHSFSEKKSSRVIDDDVLLSNGLAWTKDGTRMHHIDTLRRRLTTRIYNPATGDVGAIGDQIHFPEAWGLPDGMAADREDGLWVAFWGEGCVRRIDPQDGHQTHLITLPTSQPSSVCFGGDHFDQLYITSAWQGLLPAQRAAQPLAGAVFMIETDFVGVPTTPFQI